MLLRAVGISYMVCVPWWQNELPFIHCPSAPTLIQMCQRNCLWDHFMDQIREICVEKQTNKQKTRTKAFFPGVFLFALDRIKGLRHRVFHEQLHCLLQGDSKLQQRGSSWVRAVLRNFPRPFCQQK